MGVGPEEESSRTDGWGQDGQYQSLVPLSTTFQESQLLTGPSPWKCRDLCGGPTNRCERPTGEGRQVPAVTGDEWGKKLGGRAGLGSLCSGPHRG